MDFGHEVSHTQKEVSHTLESVNILVDTLEAQLCEGPGPGENKDRIDCGS